MDVGVSDRGYGERNQDGGGEALQGAAQWPHLAQRTRQLELGDWPSGKACARPWEMRCARAM